jgi:hypothetical protein
MKLVTENKLNWIGVWVMNQNDGVSVGKSRWLKASVIWERVWGGINFFLFGTTAPSGPGPPHPRGF